MLDLHRLRVFRSVVATGSVRAAAASLGYTPSAISQHLAALQRETGLNLLQRAGRGLHPTAAGLALAAEADEVLTRVGQTEALVADLRAGRTGSMSIAYFASVGAAWLPPLVRRLSHDFPLLRLDLRLSDDAPDDPGDRADIQILVHKGDLAPETGFTSRHLLDDPYVAVIPDTHPLATRTEIELSELAGERWIDNDFSRGWCRRVLLEACAAAGFSPPFHIEAHDYRAAIAFVAAGVGITVMPALGAAEPTPGVVVVPLVRPTPTRSIHAVVREAAERTAPVALTLDLLRATSAVAASHTPGSRSDR